MSPEQKTLVQNTWHHVVPIADTASALFYDRLFEIDPDLRAFFEGVDLQSQRKKLIQALALAVNALDNIEELVPDIEALGRRHAAYGVMDVHYETVGAALLWTLEKGLGENWTHEAMTAWTTAYTLIADTMRGATAATQDSRPTEPKAAIVA